MTPRIVSLDTTAEFGSLALIEGEELVEEVPLHSPDGFGHILFGQLDRLLRRHGWNVRELDGFAAAAGPGSFTGLRVGLAAVKGLAEAAARPAFAVSNLAAIASYGTRPLRAVVIDARRAEVYAAVYDAGLRPIVPETVTKFPAWLDSLPAPDLEFVSTNLAPFAAALAATRFAQALTTEAPRALAAAVGRIAMSRLLRGEAPDPLQLDANYVRRSDAELFWKDS